MRLDPDVFLIGIGLLLILVVLRSHGSLWRAIRYRRPVGRLQHYPSLTVIRPIKGLDPGAARNIDAGLDHGYPGPVETLFVFDDAGEPALPLVEAALKARRESGRPADARVLFAGAPKGRTGKLNAMIAGFREARGELVAFADSDTRPGPEALRTLVETLESDPRGGAAFAPVVSTEPPRTPGDAGYSLLLNGFYGPLAAEVARRRGGSLAFIMGEFMVFRREALEAIGGLESADGQLVDDMFLGQALARAGFRNLISPEPVAIVQFGLPLREFIGLYQRWIAFSRTGLPGLGFKVHSWLRGLVLFAGLALAAGGAAAGAWIAAALGALASMGTVLSIDLLHSRIGGGRLRPVFWAMPAALILIGPWIILRLLLRRRVDWRGRSYALDANSRLMGGAPGR